MDVTVIGPTLIGGALALAGTLMAQWIAERRAVEREAREREHEREKWARDLRYVAHVEFMREFHEKYLPLTESPRFPPPSDYLVPVWASFTSLRLVSKESTVTAAERAVFALKDLAFETGRWEEVSYQFDNYLGAVRDEFGLPPIPLMGA